MAESSAAWGLDAAGFRALRRVSWAVTEKIHGANFCFVIADGKVHGASRRRLLTDNEPFFGWQAVRDSLTDGLREAASTITRTETGSVERVCIYGELFGGGYPHPDVVSTPGVAPIQTGVWYTPDIRFAAFDITVEADGTRRYLDFERVQSVLTETGVPFVAPLAIGSYERVTDYPVRFDSTVPAMLGLPPLPTGSNLAEGVVVRPMREITVVGASGPVRPLLKRKIAEFADDRRFHGAQPWPEQQIPDIAGEPLDRLKWEAYCRMTENRLDATLSKVGPPPLRHRGGWAQELFALLAGEVQDEARSADAAAWGALTPGQRLEWEAYVRNEVRTLLKTRFGKDG